MIAAVLEHSPCILLVRPEEDVTRQIYRDLTEAGYDIAIASDVDRSVEQTNDLQPAMVLVDRTSTGEAGFQFCRQLRALGNRIPVLMLMSTDTVSDRVACLEAGADDYLLKPYRSETLLQLVDLYLETPKNSSEQLRFGDLTLDLNTRRAIRKGREFDLTMKEYELLKYLMSHPREVVTREQILENVWGYDFMGASNVIEVYIRYLRLKIEDEGQKRLIQTVRGVGYVLRES